MLTISKAIKAGQGEYYLSLAGVDDYYTAGTEPPGYWLGSGAVNLGLEGQLDKDEFRHLLRGLSPDGQRKLVRNADVERRAGWDLTWSAPKSVSVAWSQADPETREVIEQCLRRAVAAGSPTSNRLAASAAGAKMVAFTNLLVSCSRRSFTRPAGLRIRSFTFIPFYKMLESALTAARERWNPRRCIAIRWRRERSSVPNLPMLWNLNSACAVGGKDARSSCSAWIWNS